MSREELAGPKIRATEWTREWYIMRCSEEARGGAKRAARKAGVRKHGDTVSGVSAIRTRLMKGKHSCLHPGHLL